jgi:hypothetical protein
MKPGRALRTSMYLNLTHHVLKHAPEASISWVFDREQPNPTHIVRLSEARRSILLQASIVTWHPGDIEEVEATGTLIDYAEE